VFSTWEQHPDSGRNHAATLKSTGKSEMYESARVMENGIASVMKIAPAAKVEDLT
jgi:uncharacterized protein YegP (UPF0339 family)